MIATKLVGRGNYAAGITDFETETTIDALPISGAIPIWLRGSLYRNGPAKFDVGPNRYDHWFDGLAMIHRFTISRTNVSYQNRFLRTGAYEAAQRGHLVDGFATRRRMNVMQRVNTIFRDRPGNNTNVTIGPFSDDRLIAMTETPARVAFDAVTLETREIVSYRDNIRGQIITAHPHHDAAQRLSLNLVVEFGRVSKYHVVSLPNGGVKRTLVGSIAVDNPAYMHTFATTERYAIVTEFPLVVRPIDIVFGEKAFIDNYRWQPERGTRISVMRKSDGKIVSRYQAEACFAFHHVNAYEEADAIVLDVSTYANATILRDLRVDRLETPAGLAFTAATLRRYRLEPGVDTCAYETLSNDAVELPRLNPRNLARAYRYAYGVRSDPSDPSPVGSGLVKVDVESRTSTTWYEANTYPGEPIFVARPHASDEDDGAVVSVVFDASTGSSFLLVLEAGTFREVARVRVPHRVPLGFHGAFERASE